MPTYKVTDPNTGKTVRLTGDSPPTESELNDIFGSAPAVAKTGFGALREAEASIQEPQQPRVPVLTSFPVEPLSADKTRREEQGQQAVREAAFGARALPVMAAGMATGGAGILPAAAAMGAAGGGGELAAQALEKSGGQRAEISPAEIAGATIRSGVPVIPVGGPFVRAGANLAAQAAANIAAKSVEQGRMPTERESIFEILSAAPSGIAGGLSGLAEKGAKPLKEAAAARTRIKSETGVELPAMLGEKRESPGILRGELRSVQSGDVFPVTPSSSEIENGRRAVLLAAAKVGNETAVPADKIASDAVTTLERNFGPVSQESRASIAKLAKDYEEGRLGTQEDIQAELRSMIPGPSGESRVSLGEYIKQTAPQELSEFKKGARDVYKKLEQSPIHEDVSIGQTSNVKRWADEVGGLGLTGETKEGERVAIPSTLPEGTQKFLGQISQMSPTQSIKSLRSWRTQVLNSIGSDQVLPGVSDTMKRRLAMAITQDIEDSLSKVAEGVPAKEMKDYLTTLKSQNAAYRERIQDFDTVLSRGILAEAGTPGAKGAASISDLLTGNKAVEAIRDVKRIYGENSGPVVQKIHNLMRDEVMRSATDATTGDVSIGRLFNTISDDTKFPKELVSEVFPNSGAIQNLAKRELAARGLPSDSNAVQHLMTGDADFAKSITDAMSSKRGTAVSDSLKRAISAKAAEEAAMKDTVMKAIVNKDGDALVRNPTKIVEGFSSGAYKPDDIERAMSVIARDNPDAAKNLQFLYVENLLKKHSTASGGVDVAALAQSLAKPSKETAGGGMAAVTEAMLPKSSVESLRNVSKDIAIAEAPRETTVSLMNKAPQTTRAVLTGALIGAGTSLAMGGSPKYTALSALFGAGGGLQTRGITRELDRLRYSIAARVATSPSLSQLAELPYDSQRAANLMRIVLHDIALSSKDPEEVKAASKLESQISR